MFLCPKCAGSSLSKKGKEWGLWSISNGKCEMCDYNGPCLDVPSSIGWAWKSGEKK